MFNNQEPLQLVVTFFVLVMVMYESGVILYGEIRCSSLLGAGKGLTIYIIASIFSYFDFSNIGGQMNKRKNQRIKEMISKVCSVVSRQGQLM